jgi:glycosyltransferase involved in cell wall biosynthesis
MSGQRLVSVIIPVYNCERYLAEAIESALGQSHRPVEVIVIDDGSTDGTAAVATGFGQAVRYSYQAHGGIGVALNHGVSLAVGDFVALLDADDIWETKKLERQLSVLEVQPGPALIFGHVQQFVSPELDISIACNLRCPPEIMPGLVPCTFFTTRDTFDRVGAFETHWRAGGFLDWYLRATDLGIPTVMLPDLVMRRRLHQTNHGVVAPDAKSEFVRVLKLSIDRRRKADDAVR